MNIPFKIGIDIHGVIDTFPEKFSRLASALYKDGAEVHIVTGSKQCPNVEALLEKANIPFTHYFSIVEHLESIGETIEWRDDLPYADEHQWNIAKRDYCKKHEIDFMIDDSPIYRETFHDIDSTYLHLINRDRKVYSTR